MRLPAQLLRRKPDAHKGDFGHVFVVAGSPGLSGAAVLCAEAALRSGAGLVTLGIPKSLNIAIIKRKPLEVMTLPLPETKEGALSLAGYRKIRGFIDGVDVVALGPGVGRNTSTQGLVRKIIAECSKPLVIDADALNALKGRLDLLRRTMILTPHPGEMARLLGIRVEEVQAKRIEIARKFAVASGATVVLKGHRTVIADPSGVYVNKTGNAGMATAGSGDVLTGMIAAFLGQGLDAFTAAKCAVYLHGAAGDRAAREKTQISLIASDIIAKIPEAIKRCS